MIANSEIGYFSNLKFLGIRVTVLNSKILECQTFRIWKLMNVKRIDKFVNFWNCQIQKIVQFRKLENFRIVKIFKTIKIPKTSKLVNYHICILSVRIILKNVKIKTKFKNWEIE